MLSPAPLLQPKAGFGAPEAENAPNVTFRFHQVMNGIFSYYIIESFELFYNSILFRWWVSWGVVRCQAYRLNGKGVHAITGDLASPGVSNFSISPIG